MLLFVCLALLELPILPFDIASVVKTAMILKNSYNSNQELNQCFQSLVNSLTEFQSNIANKTLDAQELRPINDFLQYLIKRDLFFPISDEKSRLFHINDIDNELVSISTTMDSVLESCRKFQDYLNQAYFLNSMKMTAT